MWRGNKCINNFNSSGVQCPRDPSLPCTLNSFFAHFEDPNTAPSTIKLNPPPGEVPRSVTSSTVRRTLQRIKFQKDIFPYNIPGWVLRGWAVPTSSLKCLQISLMPHSYRLLFQPVWRLPPSSLSPKTPQWRTWMTLGCCPSPGRTLKSTPMTGRD